MQSILWITEYLFPGKKQIIFHDTFFFPYISRYITIFRRYMFSLNSSKMGEKKKKQKKYIFKKTHNLLGQRQESIS